jgi:hypothetical protein
VRRCRKLQDSLVLCILVPPLLLLLLLLLLLWQSLIRTNRAMKLAHLQKPGFTS